MRFIRKNGRIIPIGDKKEAGVKQKTVKIQRVQGYDMKVKERSVGVGERAKRGAGFGAAISILGSAAFAELGSKVLPRRPGLGAIAGVTAGVAAGAALASGINAAIGARKRNDLMIRPRLSKGRKIKVNV